MKTSIQILLVSILSMSFSCLAAQEYDDLYFTKKDRKKQSTVATTSSSFSGAGPTTAVDCCEPSFLSKQMAQNEELVDGNAETVVSEESINKYKRSTIDQYVNDEGEIVENPNFSQPGYAQVKEEIAPSQVSQQDQIAINNYNNSVPSRPRNPQMGFGTMFGPWGTSYMFSLGWNSFGNPWNDPFYNPWNDPFYSPFYDPWNPWGAGFGYNPWSARRWGWGGYYNSVWCPPNYGGSYANAYNAGFVNGANYGGAPAIMEVPQNVRPTVRGARNSRGGEVSTTGRNQKVRTTSLSNQANEDRDFSNAQAEYLQKSRRNTRISNANTNTSTNRTRNSNGITRDRSRSSSTGNQVNTRSQRSYRAPANRTRSTNTNRYSTPSYNQRSYSTPSNRSTNSYRSGSTRSSSGSGSMRSSGSSRSRSSGGVRSSGSSRSRRGGN